MVYLFTYSFFFFTCLPFYNMSEISGGDIYATVPEMEAGCTVL